MKQFVYFLQSASGPIKIGFSSNPIARFSSIRTGTAENTRVLAVIEGDKAMEAGLHREFASARVRSEWFRPTPELLAKIASFKSVSLKRHTSEPDSFTRAARYWVTRLEDDQAIERGTTVVSRRRELAAEAGVAPATFENLRRGRISALSAADYESIRLLFIRKSEGLAAALRSEIASLTKLVGRSYGDSALIAARARASALITILDSVSSEGAQPSA